MWLAPDHPDPEGNQLAFVVYMLRKKAAESTMPIAVFWDFACMDQKPRTLKEEKRFKRALVGGVINVLYGSSQTEVWMLTSAPGWSQRKYENSGWCSMEKAVSSLIKYAGTLFDYGYEIDKFEAQRVWSQVAPALKTHKALKAESASNKVVAHVNSFLIRPLEKARRRSLRHSTADGAVFSRDVPMLEERFAEMVEGDNVHFTNGSDVAIVKRIYGRCFEACISKATMLFFYGLQWTDACLDELALVLCHCSWLHVLVLDNNPEITEGGVVRMLKEAKRQDGALETLMVLSVVGVKIKNVRQFESEVKKTCPSLKFVRCETALDGAVSGPNEEAALVGTEGQASSSSVVVPIMSGKSQRPPESHALTIKGRSVTGPQGMMRRESESSCLPEIQIKPSQSGKMIKTPMDKE